MDTSAYRCACGSVNTTDAAWEHAASCSHPLAYPPGTVGASLLAAGDSGVAVLERMRADGAANLRRLRSMLD